MAGLIELGWRWTTSPPTGRSRLAPPAETREAIKGGGFDAVLFTSSSTVRNLVGIAGKPHNVTVIACIGPATAKTAEEHGLRVDVMAPEPSVHKLAQALADFGLKRRAAALEAGDPVTRPSERARGAAAQVDHLIRPVGSCASGVLRFAEHPRGTSAFGRGPYSDIASAKARPGRA